MMKFHEAIRLGATMTKQAHGMVMDTVPLTGEITATCAIGAAIHALDLHKTNVIPPSGSSSDGRITTMAVRMPNEFMPFLSKQHICPVPSCLMLPEPGGRMIAHLNDGHRWTREQIADWVETADPGVYEETMAHLMENADAKV